MSDEAENLVLHLMKEMRGEMKDMRSELKSDIADVRSEVNSLRADVASDMLVMRKEIGDQVVGLRRAVIEYHSSVVGHGMLISDLEARMNRVENKLGLPPLESH